MITGKNAILIYFESIHQPYFAIFYKGQVEKGNAIFRNDKTSEKDPPAIEYGEGKQSFERTLDLLGYGDYTMVISDGRNVTTRGGSRVDFKIGLSENLAQPQQASVNGFGIGSLTMEDVEKKANEIAEKRFEQLMDKKELRDTKARMADMEKELKEAQKSISDPINKFIGALAPHSEHIVSGLFGPNKAATIAPVVLSGIEPHETGEGNPEAQEAAEQFIGALAAAKPTEWISILHRLTYLIKTDQVKFEMALKFM